MEKTIRASPSMKWFSVAQFVSDCLSKQDRDGY